MAPTPEALRAAAERLRSVARRLTLDVEPLAEKGDHQTWEGPAATSFRRAAVGAEGRAGEVATGLRRIAARLDRAADDLEATARAAAAARAEAEADAARRRSIERSLAGPFDPGGSVVPAPDPVPSGSGDLPEWGFDHG